MATAYLNLRTEFSPGTGAARAEALLDRVHEFRIASVGRIDRSSLLGVESFARGAAARGLHAVFGVEFDLASIAAGPGESLDTITAPVTFPIVLFAENEAGYRNLVRLVTRAHTRAGVGATGSPAGAALQHPHERRGSGRPFLTLSDLETHHHGLIARSLGLTGEVSTWIMRGQADLAERLALRLAGVFGRSSFFLGLCLYGHPLEARLAERIADMARRAGLRTVEANEIDHLDPGDAPVRDLNAAIAAGAAWSPEHSGGSTGPKSHFRPPSELGHLYRNHPEALEAAADIAGRCQVDLLRLTAAPPAYPMPAGRSQEQYLASLCEPGPRSAVYRERLDRELGLIRDLGLAGPLLHARELVRYARSRDIDTGPGHGILAHSLVAFRLGLTEIDPVVHGLSFERFAAEAREALPEIAFDLAPDHRAELRAYAAQRFEGRTMVPMRLTRFTPAEAVRKAGEAMGFGHEDVDRVARRMPDAPDGDITKTLVHDSRLARRYRQDERVRTWLDLARRLVGLSSSMEADPDRLLIVPNDFADRVPVGPGCSGLRPAQVLEAEAARAGAVRIGLGGVRLPEPAGLDRIVRAVRPRSIADVVTAVNLHRLEAVGRPLTDLFVRRRNGGGSVDIPEAALARVLDPTEGLLLDQEQFTEAVIAVTGFTPAVAESFRRQLATICSGDRTAAVTLGPWRHRFVDAAVRRGMEIARAESVYQSLVHAGRGLPDRAGSVAVALVASRAAFTASRPSPARVSDLPRPAVVVRTRDADAAAGRGESPGPRREPAAAVLQLEMPWTQNGTERRTGTDGSR